MKKKAVAIAYYLPQYHPTKENNEWWGEGFTEWTSVAKAKPLFKGHCQPNIPADLGFYDLRVAEYRDHQAELAKRAGIDAFCYWHYWFGNGKQLLEKPLQLVIESGHPDFPFCLGWANHSWYKKVWNSDVSQLDQTMLMEQTYPGEDDIKEHFYTMLPMFKDKRYFKIKNSLVFLIYDFANIPDLNGFISQWQNLAKKNGLPPFFFIGRVTKEEQIQKAKNYAMDSLVFEDTSATSKTKGNLAQKIRSYILAPLLHRPLGVMRYEDYVTRVNNKPAYENINIYPTVLPNWDSSPRRGVGADILTHATPELFEKLVRKVVNAISFKPEEDRVLFVKSWNEWGEGNYLEPDLQYGKQRIDALHKALYDE